MSHGWKLLPLAAVFALGLVIALPGGGARPEVASAALNCDVRYIMDIEIIDLDTDARITATGSVVRISPDPQDNVDSRDYVDNADNDDSSTPGRVRESQACSATANDYTITLHSLPATLDCDIIIGSQVTSLTGSNTANPVVLFVESCSAVTPTATTTVTATPGPAKTVTVNSSQPTLGCTNTSIVTVELKDAAGASVGAGVPVTITASPSGSVSPSSGLTTANDGSVFVFYTSAANQGGLITITATAGDASGTTTITVNCGVTATATTAAPTSTTAPPPTLAAGNIQPPSTGDAGSAQHSSGQTYVGVAMVFAALCGVVMLLRKHLLSGL